MDKGLKLAWVKRLLDKRPADWKILPNECLSKYGGLFLLTCDFDIKMLKTTSIPPFYEKILRYLQDFNSKITPKQNILRNSIWNNKQIKVGNLSVFYKSWFDRGIKVIDDLLDSGNNFLSFFDFTSKYSIHTNFLTYQGVIKAVKKFLKSKPSPDTEKPF